MKLMKILDDESLVPVNALYVDGYGFGERLLEGLSVKLTIHQGKLNATANWPKGLDVAYWSQQAVEFALEGGQDMLSSTADCSGDDGIILHD